MKKSNKLLFLLLVTLLFLSVLFFTGCMDPYAQLYLSMKDVPDPPTPEITSAEFPFRLVYTVDREKIVYEDVITCEYGGIVIEEGNPEKYRIWEINYGKKPYTILRELNNEQVILFDIPCSASYLMGDPEASNYYGGQPEISLASPYTIFSSGITTYRPDRVIEAQELKDVYGIEIISFEMPPPIENTFLSEGTASDSEE